jgi:VanZ family protein
MSVDGEQQKSLGVRLSFGRLIAILCTVAALVLLVYSALGPADWQLRPGIGWKTEHFLGYFTVTSIACFAWPRPFVVGSALIVIAALLEGLQGLTPDRVPDLPTTLAGASGALSAAPIAHAFIHALGLRSLHRPPGLPHPQDQ